MKLWTQYQILVQFCFQGMSAWHSVALILAAVETWTALCDVPSSLIKNLSWSPMPICCLGTHRDLDLLFSSQRPLPWQLLSSLTSPCHSSSLLVGKDQGRREGRGRVVPAGAPHRTAGLFCKRRWAEDTVWEQQFCSAHTPRTDPGGTQLYRERRKPEQPF